MLSNLSNFIAPDSSDPRLRIKSRYQMLVDGKSIDASSGKTIDRVSPGHSGVVVGTWPEWPGLTRSIVLPEEASIDLPRSEERL